MAIPRRGEIFSKDLSGSRGFKGSKGSRVFRDFKDFKDLKVPKDPKDPKAPFRAEKKVLGAILLRGREKFCNFGLRFSS